MKEPNGQRITTTSLLSVGTITNKGKVEAVHNNCSFSAGGMLYDTSYHKIYLPNESLMPVSYVPKQVSYHFEIANDQYEVLFKKQAHKYNITIYCNHQRKHDRHDSLECSVDTAIKELTNYLTKKNNSL